MNEEQENRKNTIGTEGLAERLPELTEEELEDATKQRGVAWVWGLIGHYRPGDIHECDSGVSLQVVSIATIRCVRVYDHPEPFWNLSMIRATCEKAGVCLELGPYTVVTPLPEKVGAALPPIDQLSEQECREENQSASVDEASVEDNGYNFGMEVV